MDNLDFSEEEIQEQLALLGYKNISKHRLREFKQDLDELIRRGEWKSLASSTQINTKSQTAAAHPDPPAYTKEKVSPNCFKGTGGAFFLHAGSADHRKTLTSCQHGDSIQQQGCCDSYAQHSVAQKIKLPPGAPSRLQVEQDLEDTLQSPLTDSYTSTPDTQERRFIRRKVLRKHQGESLICDESICSEDSEEEEEEVEPERMVESKPATDADDSLRGASEEVKPELNNQRSFNSESLDETSNNEEEEEEEECSSSSDSPAPSLMTSGYGTYKPEEQEGAEYRDDHTITEFDQDSQGDLSEEREDEEDSRSLSSFGDFFTGPTHEPDFSEPPVAVSEDNKFIDNAVCCRDDGPHDDVHITEGKSEQIKKQADEEKYDSYAPSEMEASEEHHTVQAEDKFLLDEKPKHEKEVQDLHEFINVKKEVGGQVESEDPDESSSNKDIRFIDSKVNISGTMYDEMCAEWEGNLRQKKGTASCLEERLAELHLSTSPQQDFESESEDVTSQSDTQSSESDSASLSAFESYMRGMTQSDGDLRPKPKSFIRPVMSQQTIKKTDPVAKYFQYKQLWEMFKLSGEKDRRALRWEIKERLAYQPPPPKPQRVYVPNTYIVPTEKKRSALRWRIRNDLASGLLPHKFS